jgi:hypothetical protein
MKQISKTQSLLIWASGFDNQTAAQCTSSEIRKMTIAGSMVFIPAFLALFSYSYGFYFIFHNTTSAIIGGIVSAIVLFVIDRSIMAYGRPGSFSLGLLGRIMLAVTVGFLLAEPLILKIFEDSIQEQQFSELSTAKESASAPYDSRIKVLQDELTVDQQRLYKLQQAYTAEMDGTGGSMIRNQGPIYEQKYQDYQDYQKLYASNRNATAAKIAEIQKQKTAALDVVEHNNADGLIGRMRALSSLGEKEPIVHWTTWLLRIFFTLIELLPLLIKISPAGDRGLYYKLVDMNDVEKEQIFEMSSKERLEFKQQEEKLRLTQAFAELCHKETQIIACNKEKDSIYLMAKAQELTEKKIDFVGRAIKHIKEEGLLKEVLARFDQIHAGFMNTINQLITKSNSNFSPDKG